MSARLLQIQPADRAQMQNLFFAYGANMNLAQIRKRCAHPWRVAVASLQDFRIGFYGHSEKWDGALETAIEAKGHQLWGVLFALNDLDWERLDLWQDARFDGAGMYFHYLVEVCDAEEKNYEARLYKKDILSEPRRPSKAYMKHILCGARENHLPPTYIESLLAIETTQAPDVGPICDGLNPASSAGKSCAACLGAL